MAKLACGLLFSDLVKITTSFLFNFLNIIIYDQNIVLPGQYFSNFSDV
jgi:hypothetical protein